MLLPSQISGRQQDVLYPSAIVLCIILGNVSYCKRLTKSPVLKKLLGFGVEGIVVERDGASPNTVVFATGARNNKIRFLRGSAPQVINSMFHFISWLYTKWRQVQCSDCYAHWCKISAHDVTVSFCVLQSPRNSTVTCACRCQGWPRLA
jgi:hypothetical protein